MLDSIASPSGAQQLLSFLVSSSRSPKIPAYNHTPTSTAEARTGARCAPNLRAAVLDHITTCGRYGATADEVCHTLDMLPQSATPRINELAKAGAIIDSGSSRLTRSGRAAVRLDCEPQLIQEGKRVNHGRQQELDFPRREHLALLRVAVLPAKVHTKHGETVN